MSLVVYQSRAVLEAIKKDTSQFRKIQSWWRTILNKKENKRRYTAVKIIQRLFRSRVTKAMISHLHKRRRTDLVDYLRVTSRMVNIIDCARASITCPITQEIAKTPVINLKDGHVYEKSALCNWVQGHFTSPMTRAFTLPWHIVSFREVHSVFEAMSDCIQGRDFYCPRCNLFEFRFGGEMGFCISTMWLKCQQHLISECPFLTN